MASIAINPHMTVIQVNVGQNLVDDVLLDGGSGANIIAEDLRRRFELPSLKPTPYML